MNGLLHGPNLNARQTPDGLRKMAVGARIILRPERHAVPEVAIETARVTVVRPGREHEPREGPLALSCQSGVSSKLKYSTPGSWWNGFWKRVERAEENEAASQQTRMLFARSSVAPIPRIPFTRPAQRLAIAQYCVRAQSLAVGAAIGSPRDSDQLRSSALRSHRRVSSAGRWTLSISFWLRFCLTAIGKEFHKSDSAIALSITATLAFRPVGAFLFGLLADRYGRRLPLMIDLVFYSVVEVLTGLAPNYTTFLVLRALFGIGMGGEWGVGASLAMEKVPPRLRGVLSGLLQEGYAAGNLLAAIAYFFLFQRWGWRPLFFLGGLPALLALFVRFRVKESEVWEKSREKTWSGLGRAIVSHWKLFLYLTLLMTMMNFVLARHAGHVSDVPGAPVALRTLAAIRDYGHFDDRSDSRRHRYGTCSRTASAAAA